MVSFLGCHGTSLSAGKNIVKTNFEISKNLDEWLGDGAYFFVEGINNNIDLLATKWANCQAWDNSNKSYLYNEYCVIKSEIQVEDDFLLDLTKQEGLEVFEYIVDKFIDRISSLNKKLKFLDGMLINLARDEKMLRIDVVKGNFYIKFTKERVYRIHLRTNNCTICSVFDVDNTIVSKSIIKTGEVEYEIK